MIRKAEYKDLEELLEIYNYEVEHGVATLDLEKKTFADREKWFFEHQSDIHPLFVYEKDEKVAGYANLSPYREKEAYKSTVELSVYVGKAHQGQGIATALLDEILAYARENYEIHNVVSVITSGNEVSIRLHEKFGFEFCGTIREVGMKFGKYLDIDNYSLIV
ncbi:MAG: N-acetyltransferase [Clostridia bacterium]|nr:N-acetyltransferase [Clostridia bacterium]